jgi:hypothetical protein
LTIFSWRRIRDDFHKDVFGSLSKLLLAGVATTSTGGSTQGFVLFLVSITGYNYSAGQVPVLPYKDLPDILSLQHL